LLQLTASTGSPNSTPRRAFTSTKATVPARSTTRSMSRWPFRNRRWTTRYPCRRSHRSAIRSPSSPNACLAA